MLASCISAFAARVLGESPSASQRSTSQLARAVADLLNDCQAVVAQHNPAPPSWNGCLRYIHPSAHEVKHLLWPTKNLKTSCDTTVQPQD
eukprot:s4557_g5.t1